MKLVPRGHRGIIGIESAIVMIAFVIVAAALAFVVLNMGFSTTQKAKTSIIASLEEASSSLEIAGKIIGIADQSAGLLNATAVPIKVASGGSSVNLNNETAAIKYLSNLFEYDNIYVGYLNQGVHSNLTEALEAAVTAGMISSNPVNSSAPDKTSAIIYWTVNRNNNFILDMGEHAVLAIAFSENERPAALDTIRAEVFVPTGAPLTIERLVPNVTHFVLDLG